MSNTQTISRFPLQWPAGWKRTPRFGRKAGMFRAGASRSRLSVAAAMERVREEVGRMGIRDDDLVISTNLPLRLDGFPRSDQSEPEPGVYRQSRAGAWRRVLPPWSRPASFDLVEFPEQNIVLAKDQPQYRPMPAFRALHDPEGRLVCCWRLRWIDRLRVLCTGRVWHHVLTFNQPLQPQLLSATKPGMRTP